MGQATFRCPMEKRLTKYESASIKELLVISFPIMISALSGLLMNFCDRVILAHYSTDAMNAGITAGMAANVFLFGFLAIALIAEVFVGKKNGAGRYKEASRPVWQMIWFSLASAAIFWPFAFWLSHLFVPAEEFSGMATTYFQLLMYFGPLFPLVGALSGFFIGVGKTRLVSIAAIVGNLVNVVSDTSLVFGYGDIVPELGVAGAAIGTGIAQFIQVFILFLAFFSHNNRKKYGTTNYGFDRHIMLDCLKVGTPSSIGHMIEIAAWAILLRLMAQAGDDYITLVAFGQSMHVLFAFATEGLQKGVTTIAANLIGGDETRKLKKLVKSALRFLLIIMAILFIPLVIYPDPIIQVFLLDEFQSQRAVYDLSRLTGIFVWGYLFLDGMVWIFAGILTAFGDTKFIMVVNALLAWAFALLPTYIFINVLHGPAYLSWLFTNLYAFMNMILFWRRSLSIQKRGIA